MLFPTMAKQLVSFITCAASRVHPFCNLQSREQAHAALVNEQHENKFDLCYAQNLYIFLRIIQELHPKEV
jgi:hypothetical protein